MDALGRSWGALGALVGRSGTLVGASGRSWALLGGFEVGFGRVWGGSGEGLGWFLQQASSRSSSKAVPYDRACFGLLGHAFARQSVELILNLNSSWLYCLCLALPWFAWLYLALPCFTLLGLTLLMRFPFHCYSGFWGSWALFSFWWFFCLSLGCFFRSCGAFFRFFYAS